MKKLLIFTTLLLSVFSLTGCKEEDLTELHEAIDNTALITNAKITVTSEAMGFEFVIEEYVSDEAIMIIMAETIVTEEMTMYGLLDGDELHLISPESLFYEDSPFIVTEIVNQSEYIESLGSYDVFKEGDFKKEGDYYVAEDVDFSMEGYEDVDEIQEVKVKVEDGIITEIIMTMETEGIEVTASIVISQIGEISVDLPPYFQYGDIEVYQDALAGHGLDFMFFQYEFEVVFEELLFSYTHGNTEAVFLGTDDDLFYNIEDDTFTLNSVEYSYDDYFTNTTPSFTKAQFDTVKELIDIYK